VITLNKNNQRLEQLGLTLVEAKQLLNTLQRYNPQDLPALVPDARRSGGYAAHQALHTSGPQRANILPRSPLFRQALSH
jgi:hypothetical protein